MGDRITAIKREIYVFIREYGQDKRVNLWNIQLFADKKGISRREMGVAMQDLKQKRAIFYNPRRGWIAR